MAEKESLRMVAADEWLKPVEGEIEHRHNLYKSRLEAICSSSGSIVDYANGYKYYGWQYDETMCGWWFREWLPEAYDVYIFGDFNGWQRTQLRLDKDSNGVWSIFLPEAMYGYRLTHGSLYKLHIHGANGWLDRIPAYATRVVQDEQTKDYTAQFWIEQPFEWTDSNFSAAKCSPLLIYETHVGMAQEREGVGTYREFETKILPKVRRAGYNAIQVMAIAEHPYYGSFAVQSFDPRVLRYFKKHRPRFARGQLVAKAQKRSERKKSKGKDSQNPIVSFMLSHLLLNVLSRPDFISIEKKHTRELGFVLATEVFKAKAFIWTVKSEKQYDFFRKQGYFSIFESIRPE